MTLGSPSFHDETVHKLGYWFHTPAGRAILRAEQQWCQQQLKKCYGYHAVQLGGLGDNHWLQGCLIRHQVGVARKRVFTPLSQVVANWETLPFASESIDLICLPHTLEICQQPKQVLEECFRVLIPSGKLIVLGFNPSGWWRYWSWLTLGTLNKPPIAHWHQENEVKGWLAQQDFFALSACKLFHLPPLGCGDSLKYLQCADDLLATVLPALGAVYASYCEKRMHVITPIKPKWANQPRVGDVSAAESSRQGVDTSW
jgi:ubiquinone/menaquinone biosynthesis C-methylase UbiE